MTPIVYLQKVSTYFGLDPNTPLTRYQLEALFIAYEQCQRVEMRKAAQWN